MLLNKPRFTAEKYKYKDFFFSYMSNKRIRNSTSVFFLFKKDIDEQHPPSVCTIKEKLLLFQTNIHLPAD